MTTKAELQRSINELMADQKRLERSNANLECTRDGQRKNIGKLQEKVAYYLKENQQWTDNCGALENNVAASKNAINSLNDELELLESDNVKFKAMLQMLIGGKYLQKDDVEKAADFLLFVDWY